jgi:predicted phage-related endonuclease
MTMNGPQYLEERRKGIGGSDIAAVLGLSPWKTAYQVYQEKRKEVVDNGSRNQRGGRQMRCLMLKMIDAMDARMLAAQKVLDMVSREALEYYLWCKKHELKEGKKT